MKRSLAVCVLAAAALMFATQAQATSIPFNLGYVFSGDVPSGVGPYATVVFNDLGDCVGGPCAANTVQVIITASLNASSELLSEWDFNSSVALGAGAISQTGKVGSFTDPTIEPYDLDKYKADGDGNYDLSIVFDTSGGTSTTRFDGVDSATFLITGPAGGTITASTFDAVSVGGALGAYHTAVHVQGIPINNCSGWVGDGSGAVSSAGNCGRTVPDSGATVALLGLALVGVGYIRRKIG